MSAPEMAPCPDCGDGTLSREGDDGRCSSCADERELRELHAALGDLLKVFTFDDIRALVHTAAEMAGEGASHHDLSSRQIALAEKAAAYFAAIP